MAKKKRSEPNWVSLNKAFAREMNLSKKALKKAVENATIRLVAEQIAVERLKGSRAGVKRAAQASKSGKKKKTTKKKQEVTRR